MRKAFISFLIMTLMLTNISLVNISGVQAATNYSTDSNDSTIKVSLGNIREIMTENSLDIKNLNNNLKIAKEQYENAKNDLEDAQENLEDAEDAEDAEEDAGDKGDAAAAEAAVEAAEAALDNAKKNLKSVKSTYEQGVENKIYDAQGAYLNYLSSLADVKLKEDTVKSKLKEVQTSKFKYESGFLSKNDYIELGLGKTDSSNELIKIKADLELTRIKLCNTLGLSPNEDITFETEIIEDFKVISEINFNNDLNEMIDNSINIKLQKDEVEDAEDDNDDEDKDDIYEYKVDTAKNKLKQLTNTEQTSFLEQYNTLMSSYNSIKNSYDQIIQKQMVYKTTQIKFDYGFLSQSGLDTAKLTLDTDMAKFIKDRNACYLKYLKYIEMKEGY